MDPHSEPTLAQVIAWAKTAGELVRANFNKPHTIGYKGEVDVVTESDKKSEEYLLGQLAQTFPHHAILTEESGEHAGESDHLWIIDPLDGTVNYAHRLPIYSISIAYQLRGQLQLGVVYDPSRDECFSAERGQGAFLNGQPIAVSGATQLIQTLMVTGFPYDRQSEDYFRSLRLFGHITSITQGVRRLGSAALDLCYVAAGRMDAYFEHSIHPWDIAAAALIVQEAGGKVTDIHGEAHFMKEPYSLIGSAPGVYAALLAELEKTR
ncbi:MAG: inositol monophosphatase [Anaerolineaceae bacterium]|nr:inositol monophosphatase [Anaerolineaceae bacterium]